MTHHFADLYQWWLHLPDVVWGILITICVGGLLLTSALTNRNIPR